jgi:pimeloyl-ACP methyl ester carboxylesterase
MKENTQTILYKSSLIHVWLYGEGNRWLFCFHGFGEEGSSFSVLENSLGASFALAAIDLPFHGKTKWNEGLLFTPEDLLSIITIIQNNNNKINSDLKFSLLGFSLGGRVALHLLQMVPSQIERVVLIAPDGLHLNFWYWIGTQTSIGNNLFNQTMKNPSWFFAFINGAYKIGLLNKSITKFVHFYLDDEQERKLLYQRWTTMRKFKPNATKISKVIDKFQIAVRILFGKYDRIILSKRSGFFRNSKNVQIKIIDTGHQLLRQEFIDVIASLFSQ